MLLLLVIILIAASAVLKYYEPTIKGGIGEKRVIKQLDKLDANSYRVLNDVLLPTNRGTTQIDHIIISVCGIFVIETKNYQGWIHGSERSEYWSQTIYRSKKRFRNPIRQNWGHIMALKGILPREYTGIPYYPIIVFAGNAKLKNVEVTTNVIYDDQVYNTITGHRGLAVLSSEDVERIEIQIRQVAVTDEKVRKQHVQTVRSEVRERKAKEASEICPKCGGNLIRRTGKYGGFFGCSNYPRCKFTLQEKR